MREAFGPAAPTVHSAANPQRFPPKACEHNPTSAASAPWPFDSDSPADPKHYHEEERIPLEAPQALPSLEERNAYPMTPFLEFPALPPTSNSFIVIV